ncbi:MAG: hypothetical protein U0105_00815 [Candidatus Obscuribacterales bacterium]
MAPVTDAPEDPKKKPADPAVDAADDPNATTTEVDQTSTTLHSDADGADPAFQQAFTLSLNAQQEGALPYVTEFNLTGTALPTDLANKNLGTLNAADLSLAVNPLPASLSGDPDLAPGAVVSPELSPEQIAAAGGDATFLATLTANQASYAATQTELNARHAKGDYSDLDVMFKNNPEVAQAYRTKPEYAEVMKEYNLYTQRKQAGDYSFIDSMTPAQVADWSKTASPEDVAGYANYTAAVMKGDYSYVDRLSAENRSKWMIDAPQAQFDGYWNFAERKQAGDYSYVDNLTTSQYVDFIANSSEAEFKAYMNYQDNVKNGNFGFVDKMTPQAQTDWIMNSSDKDFQGYLDYKDKIANGDYGFVDKLNADNKSDFILHSSNADFDGYMNYQNRIAAGDWSHIDNLNDNNLNNFIATASDAEWQSYMNYKDKINAGDYSFTEKLNDANYSNFVLNSSDEQFNAYLNYTERKAAGDYSYVDRLNASNKGDFIVNSSDEDFNKYMDYKNRQASGDFSYVDRLSNEAQSDWFATASADDLNGYFNYRDKVAANDYSFLNGLNSNNLTDWQKNATPEQLQAAIDYAQKQANPAAPVDTTAAGTTLPAADVSVQPIQAYDANKQPIPPQYDANGKQIAPVDAEGKAIPAFDASGNPIQSFEAPKPAVVQPVDDNGKPLTGDAALPKQTAPVADVHAPKVVKGPDGKLMLVTADSPGVPVPATAAENKLGTPPASGDLNVTPPLTPEQIEAKRLAGTSTPGATTPLTEQAKQDIATNLEKLKDDPVARAKYLAQVSNMGPEYRAQVQGDIAKARDTAGKQAYGQALTELIRQGQPVGEGNRNPDPTRTPVEGGSAAIAAANEQRAKLEQARTDILKGPAATTGDGTNTPVVAPDKEKQVIDKFGQIRDVAPVAPVTGNGEVPKTPPGTNVPPRTEGGTTPPGGVVPPVDLQARATQRTELLAGQGLIDKTGIDAAKEAARQATAGTGAVDTTHPPAGNIPPADRTALRNTELQRFETTTPVVPGAGGPDKPVPLPTPAEVATKLSSLTTPQEKANYLASFSNTEAGKALASSVLTDMKDPAAARIQELYKKEMRVEAATSVIGPTDTSTPRLPTEQEIKAKISGMNEQQKGEYLASVAAMPDGAKLVKSYVGELDSAGQQAYDRRLKEEVKSQLPSYTTPERQAAYLAGVASVSTDSKQVVTDVINKLPPEQKASITTSLASPPPGGGEISSGQAQLRADIIQKVDVPQPTKDNAMSQLIANVNNSGNVKGATDLAAGQPPAVQAKAQDIITESKAKVTGGTDAPSVVAPIPTDKEITRQLQEIKRANPDNYQEQQAKYLASIAATPEGKKAVDGYLQQEKVSPELTKSYQQALKDMPAPAPASGPVKVEESRAVELDRRAAAGVKDGPAVEPVVQKGGPGATADGGDKGDKGKPVVEGPKGPVEVPAAVVKDVQTKQDFGQSAQQKLEIMRQAMQDQANLAQLNKTADHGQQKALAEIAAASGVIDKKMGGDGKGGPEGVKGPNDGGKPMTIEQMRDEIRNHIATATSAQEMQKWEQAGRRLDFIEKAGNVITDANGNRVIVGPNGGALHLDERGQIVNAAGKPIFGQMNRDGMIDQMGTVFTKVGGTGLPMTPGSGKGELGVSLTGKDGVIIGKDGVVIGKDGVVIGKDGVAVGRDGSGVLRLDPTTGRPILDPITGKPIFDFPGGKHDGLIMRGETTGIAGPLPPGARLEIGGRDGFVRIDPATGKPIEGIRFDANGKPIEGLRIDPITGKAELIGGKGEIGGVGRQAIDPTTGLPIRGTIGLDGIPIGKFDAKGMPITDASGKAVAVPGVMGPGGVFIPGVGGKAIAADGTGVVQKDAQGNVINPTTGAPLINVPGFGQQPTGTNLPGAAGSKDPNVPGAGGAGGGVQLQAVNLPGIQITGTGGAVVGGQSVGGQPGGKEPGQQGQNQQQAGASVSVTGGQSTNAAGQVVGPGGTVVAGGSSGTVVVGMTVTTGKDSISAGGGLSVSGVGLNATGGINVTGGANVTGGVSLTGATALADKNGLPGAGATVPGGKELAPGATATATNQVATSDPNAAQTNFAPPAAQDASADRKIVLDGSGKSATTADGTVVTVDANRQITSSNATVYIDNHKGFAITDGGGVIFVDKNGNLKVLLDELPADSQQATGNSKAISWQDTTGQQYTTANSHVVSIDNGTVTKYGDEPHVIVLSPDGRPVSSGDTTTIILNGTRPTGVGDDVIVVIDKNPNLGSGNIVYVSPDGKPLESSSGTLVWVDQTGQTQGSNVHIFFTDTNGHPIAQDSSSAPTGNTVVLGGQLVTHNPQDVDNIPPDVLSQMLKDVGITTSSGTAIPTNNTSTDTGTQIGTGTQTGTEIKTGDNTQTGTQTGTTTPPSTEIKTGDNTQTGTQTGTTTPPSTEIKTGDNTQTETTTGTNTTTTNPDGGHPTVPTSGEIVVTVEPTSTSTSTPTPTPKSDVEAAPKLEVKPEPKPEPKPDVQVEPKPEPLPVPKGSEVTPTGSHEPDIVVHVQVGDSSHSTSQPVSHSDGGYSSQAPVVHETSSGGVVYSNPEPVSHQTQPGYSVVDAVVDIAIGSQSGQPVQAHSEPVANQDVVTAQPKAHTDVEYSAGLGDASATASVASTPAYFDPMPANSAASFPLDDISHSSEIFPHQVAEVTHKIESETVEHSFIEAPTPRAIEDFAVSRPNDVVVKETTDNSPVISQQTPSSDLTPPFAPMLEPTVPPAVTLPQAEQAGYSVADQLVANTNPPVVDPQPVMSDIDTPVQLPVQQVQSEPVNPFIDGMNQVIAPALDVAPIASHRDHDRDDEDEAQPAISLPALPVDVTTIGSAPLVELADPTVPGGLNTEAIIHDMEDRAEVGRLMGTSYDWKVEEINKYDEIEKERRERYELELAENRRRDQELREDREQRELEERAKRFSDAMLAAMATKKTRNPVEGLEENFVPEVRQKYVVLQGDTLESIAIKKLRDKRLAPLLYEINKHLIPSRMQGDIRYLQLSPRSVIQLPTQAEIRRFHARLFGRQSIKFQYEEASEGNCNSSRATNPGLIRLGLLPAAAVAGQPKSEAEVEKAATRRANVESLLGSVAKTQAPPADGRIRYICRLGDTLRSVAMRHPALKDVTLWKLLAEVNELTTDVDGKGTPIAQFKRGTTISLPTLEEIESFKLKLKPSKTGNKAADQITAPQAPYSVPAASDPSMATTIQDVQIKIGDESQDVTQDPVIVAGSGTVVVTDDQTGDPETRVTSSNVLPFVRPGDMIRYTPPGIATRDPDDATNSLLQAAGMVPREGQQLQKAVGDDRGQRNIIQHLSETCRIVNYGNTGEGDGAGFRTRLEVRQEDFWRPVIQYEVNADVTLRHEFSVSGKKSTSRIDLPPHAAKELAENDISAHWEKYSCNFQQGRKIAE